MEGEADSDDLRFRLDWPKDESGAPDDEVADFSFDWDDRRTAPTALVEAGEPEADVLDVPQPPAAAIEPEPEPAPDVYEPIDYAPVAEDLYDTGYYDNEEALAGVRRVLNDHNDALVQLSDAVYELAANVGHLLNEFRTVSAAPVVAAAPAPSSDVGGVTASAIVKMTAAIESLGEELGAVRVDFQAMADDVVAAAGGQGVGGPSAQPRVFVELDRVRAELQALKRRLPVGAKGLDPADIADRVADAVLTVLNADVAVAPVAQPAPKPAPARRPVRATPAPAKSGKRQRPLRAD